MTYLVGSIAEAGSEDAAFAAADPGTVDVPFTIHAGFTPRAARFAPWAGRPEIERAAAPFAKLSPWQRPQG